MKGGIYILTTPTEGNGFEYRVVHAYDMDRIWHTTGARKYECINTQAISDLFSRAKPFSDKLKADDYASNMFYRYELSDPELVNDGVNAILIEIDFKKLSTETPNAEEKATKKTAKQKTKASPKAKSKEKKPRNRNLP